MKVGAVIGLFTLLIAILAMVFFAFALFGTAENETAALVPSELAPQYNITAGVVGNSLSMSGYFPYLLIIGILIAIFSVAFLPALRR